MKRDKPDLLDWLGLRREFDFAKARWLGSLVSVAIALLLAVLLISAIIEFVQASWSDDPDATALRNAGLVLAAMIGVPFLVWRSVVAQKQVDVAEQGHITDRINKAVQGLGAEKVVNRLGRIVSISHVEGETTTLIEWQDEHLYPSENPDVVHIGEWQTYNQTQPNLEVRIGSIYALERIAQDSDRDHVQIMEILCAYIRENAPAKLAEPFPKNWLEEYRMEDASPLSRAEITAWTETLKLPREDIQVALNVLGRRSKRQIALEGCLNSDGDWEGFRIDLRQTCMQRADLYKAAFDNADLSEAHMQGANLKCAQMQWVRLIGAQMQGANCVEMRLQGARLWESHMQGAYFNNAKMQRVNLGGARVQTTVFYWAQLQGAKLWETRMDQATVLSDAVLRGVGLKYIDLSAVSISQDQINSTFGDQSVILAEGLIRPDWPENATDNWDDFHSEWRAWQKEIGFDPNDPSTW